MVDESARRQARAQRFKEEAKRGPPPLPVKRMAHPGGKIVTSDRDKALAALIARKQRNGEELTVEQKRALSEKTADFVNRATQLHLQAGVCPPSAEPVNVAFTKQQPAVNDASGKRLRVLRKKLRDIEILQERQREGAILQQNQVRNVRSKFGLSAPWRTRLRSRHASAL